MDRNHWNSFERGPTKDHFCEVWSKFNQLFRRKYRLKKLFTVGRTDERTHDRQKCDHKSSPCQYVTGELKIKFRMSTATDLLSALRVNVLVFYCCPASID